MKLSKRDKETWNKASSWDKSLAIGPDLESSLCSKKLARRSFSRGGMFKHMAEGRVYLVRDLAIATAVPDVKSNKSEFMGMISEAFLQQDKKARIQRGKSATRGLMPVPDLVESWLRGRSVVSTTNLRFRGTAIERQIDVSPLSFYNLLPEFGEEIRSLEIMSLLISTAGNVTDSHTDDFDVSNHCFIGSKLWLVWDRIEGQKQGLEDCTHDQVYDWAKFDMRTFLELESSHWLVVSEGDTLFLPGHFAHKVITLESYAGFGSFHFNFANLIMSFKRWLLDEPIYVTRDMLEVISEKIDGWMASKDAASLSLRKNAGAAYLNLARRHWLETESDSEKGRLFEDPVFSSMFQSITKQPERGEVTRAAGKKGK